MAKYKVSVREVYTVIHIVEADNEEQAIDKALFGDSDQGEPVYDYTLDESSAVHLL